MRTIALVIVSLIGVQSTTAQTKQPAIRQHFTVAYEPAGLSYKITKISETPNETETREIYLVEDARNGDRLILTNKRDYLDQTGVREIMDLSTKEVVRATVQLPYKSATIRETIEEARKMGTLNTKELNVTIELNGVLATATEAVWESGRARDARSSLRRAASAQFLERLERLRPIIGRAELAIFCAGLMKMLLYNEACEVGVALEHAEPDCAFDALFYYPCSDQQRQRIATAKAAGKDLSLMRY